MNQLGLAHNDYLQYEYGESGPAAIRMIDRGVKLLRTIDSIQEFADEREFNSGDVHWGEINRQDVPGGYPLHDVTASGLNRDWDTIEPSTRRLGPAVPEYNFGSIEIDWGADDPNVRLLTVDLEGKERNVVRVKLSELTAGRGTR